MAERKRVGVLISGRGSNMAALEEASREDGCPYEIALVISNRAAAPGLDYARERGIATHSLRIRDFADRQAFDMEVDRQLRAAGCEFVALAGYMRLLSPQFVHGWQNRMINIHPSLLPSFKGLDTHEQALEAGCKLHGCSVHFVTAELDDGPIIAQAAVPILDEDTPDTLAARVLVEEHRIYPEALRALTAGDIKVEGRRVKSRSPKAL